VLILKLLAVITAAVAGTPVASPTPDRTVGFDGMVFATSYVGSTLYVGGEFQNAVVSGRKVPRAHLAAIDVRTGALLPWAPVTNATVRALTAAGSWLYIAGGFERVGGQPRAGLSNVDLRTGAVGPLRHTVQGTPYALANAAGRLYLGGRVSGIDGRPVPNLAAFSLATGALDPTFRAGTDEKVEALTVGGTRLYVGGRFGRLDGVAAAARLGAVRLTDGRLDTSFHAAAPYWVSSIALGAGAVYAGLGGPGGRTIAYRMDGRPLWTATTDGDIQALAYLDGVVYAGGHFDRACTRAVATPTSWCSATVVSRLKLTALDPATGRLLPFNPRVTGVYGVTAMSADPRLHKFAIGGQFSTVGGVAHPYFAQFTVKH
jgi:outer membrane protein assembly factor BamB